MLKLKQSLAIVALMACAGFALAAGKIAVVDIQRAIIDTEVAKERLASLREEADFKGDMEEVEEIKKEGQALVEKLQKDGPVMSSDQQAALQKKIQEKQADLEHIARKLQAKEQEVLQEIIMQRQEQTKKVINELIQSEGIGLLLDKRAAIHAEPGFDITAKVTSQLNAQ